MPRFYAVLLPLVVIGLDLAHGPPTKKPKLLLVSFDGFRWDYLTKTDTPNYDKVIESGVKAKWIKDTFVSLTFPNHYTIVTGMYEESHGIIANNFYDPKFGEVFNIKNRTTVQDGKFWGGEPIWVTNQLQGGRSGVYFWVGSEAEIKGVRPTYWEEYLPHNATIDVWKNHTDTVVKWLADPDPRNIVDLALLYFKEPDRTGHIYGPESPELVKMVQQCDNITGYLFEQLEKHDLLGEINVIITSDHGMTSMNRSRFITLEGHVDKGKTDHLINYFDGAAVWPKAGKGITEDLYHNLSSISDHVPVWMKKDIPPEYHYSNNRRIPPILLAADEGWGIKWNWDDDWYLLGRHGFNNSEMDMHPFFMASGPAFKKGYISEPFENIHIYELMCHILGVKPAPNNGSLSAVRHLLSTSMGVDMSLKLKYTVGKWAGIIIGILMGVAFLFYVIKEVAALPKKASRRRKEQDRFLEFDEFEDESLLLSSTA